MAKTYYYFKGDTGMEGPYSLTYENAGSKVLHSPGIYYLAEKQNEKFLITYIGRASDLGSRLTQHIGKTSHFYYKPSETEAGAFFMECRAFHHYGKANNLDNRIHPARPSGSSLPLCSEEGCKGEAY